MYIVHLYSDVSNLHPQTYLEVDIVADQDVSLHEILFILPVFSDYGEGVIDSGAQDAD